MSKDIDFTNLHLGLPEETVERWIQEGLFQPMQLPQGTQVRNVTPEYIDRIAVGGKLYQPWPEGLIERLAAHAEDQTQPPDAA